MKPEIADPSRSNSGLDAVPNSACGLAFLLNAMCLPDGSQRYLAPNSSDSTSFREAQQAIHGERLATGEEMRKTVFEYIEVDYNRTRRYGANGYISPEAFEVKEVA